MRVSWALLVVFAALAAASPGAPSVTYKPHSDVGEVEYKWPDGDQLVRVEWSRSVNNHH